MANGQINWIDALEDWVASALWDRYHWVMPTVFRLGPYRFFFYAGDRDEPAHVHVERDEAQAKFWLAPIRLARSRGFGRKELNRIRKIIEQNQARLIESWNEFFIG